MSAKPRKRKKTNLELSAIHLSLIFSHLNWKEIILVCNFVNHSFQLATRLPTTWLYIPFVGTTNAKDFAKIVACYPFRRINRLTITRINDFEDKQETQRWGNLNVKTLLIQELPTTKQIIDFANQFKHIRTIACGENKHHSGWQNQNNIWSSQDLIESASSCKDYRLTGTNSDTLAIKDFLNAQKLCLNRMKISTFSIRNVKSLCCHGVRFVFDETKDEKLALQRYFGFYPDPKLIKLCQSTLRTLWITQSLANALFTGIYLPKLKVLRCSSTQFNQLTFDTNKIETMSFGNEMKSECWQKLHLCSNLTALYMMYPQRIPLLQLHLMRLQSLRLYVKDELGEIKWTEQFPSLTELYLVFSDQPDVTCFQYIPEHVCLRIRLRYVDDFFRDLKRLEVKFHELTLRNQQILKVSLNFTHTILPSILILNIIHYHVIGKPQNLPSMCNIIRGTADDEFQSGFEPGNLVIT